MISQLDDIDLLIGRSVNELIDARRSFYVYEIRDDVLTMLPESFREQLLTFPWAREYLLDGLHRKVYKWISHLPVTGHFKSDGKAVRHNKYGCMPDGKGNHLWFLVAEATDEELSAWQASREKKIAKQMMHLETIREIRAHCQGRRPQDVIVYE